MTGVKLDQNLQQQSSLLRPRQTTLALSRISLMQRFALAANITQVLYLSELIAMDGNASFVAF